MINWEQNKIDLNNIGVGTFDNVDINILDYLKTQIKNKKKLQKFNDQLVGHINDEYIIKITPEYSNYLCNSINTNNKLFNYLNNLNVLSKNCPIFLEKSWINFQKKYEFNPLHDHSGIFSFIIFMKIPYKLEEEHKLYTVIDKPANSCLCFVYTNTNGEIKSLNCNVDESYLHKMLIFPSKLKHQVYPFYTSNEERITVSGNIRFLV